MHSEAYIAVSGCTILGSYAQAMAVFARGIRFEPQQCLPTEASSPQ